MPAGKSEAGFSAVEVVVLTAILSLLALVMIPYQTHHRHRHEANQLAIEFRKFATTFRDHRVETGDWPQDAQLGQIPQGMEDLLPGFSSGAGRFGSWDWDVEMVGYKAGLALVEPCCCRDVLQHVDHILDDGSLTSGMMRMAGNRYVLVLER